MRIGNEDVTLVTDFGELRVGMIVWVVNCSVCSKKHRHILMELEVSEYGADDDLAVVGPAWNILPGRPCFTESDPVVSPETVSRRHVFRVVDRALDAATTARKREAVRP